MTTRQIKTARTSKIPHEIGQVLERTSVFRLSLHCDCTMQECFYWSNDVTWCVTWIKPKLLRWKSGQRTLARGKWKHSIGISIGEEDTAKSVTKCPNNRQQKKQTASRWGRRNSPKGEGHSPKCNTKRLRQLLRQTLILLNTIFDREGTQMTPPLTDVNALSFIAE